MSTGQREKRGNPESGTSSVNLEKVWVIEDGARNRRCVYDEERRNTAVEEECTTGTPSRLCNALFTDVSTYAVGDAVQTLDMRSPESSPDCPLQPERQGY